MRKRYVVDLFAGCGGLSLGLERSGFTPSYVNELNRDALETYLVNREGRNPLLREKYNSNDIKQLASRRDRLERVSEDMMADYGIPRGELDLVVGGPPCQGFSVIGHRRSFDVQKKELPYNYLYRDMVKVIRHMRPKCFLFENVGGLLSGRWSKKGENGEIWRDVLKRFKALDYTVRWDLVYSKEYGVPQNRPRVMMVGLRDDMSFDEVEDAPAGGLLPGRPDIEPPGPAELLGDLVDPNYLGKKSTDTYLKDPRTPVQEALRDGLERGDPLTEHEYAIHSREMREKFTYMIKNHGRIQKKYQTRKFYQKVLPRRWGEAGPNITIASNPVDFIHYLQPRHLTVREYARFQMFPDTYRFVGKRHTGGRRRAGDPDKGIWDREVPKYTQIGNAVPVRLAEQVGRHLRRILRQ